MLQYTPVNLQSLLQALADERGVDLHEVDPELWRPLTRNLPMDNLDVVLRRDSVGRQQMWQPLMAQTPLTRLDELLKRDSTHYASLQALSNGEAL